jgi:hypothetical protein
MPPNSVPASKEEGTSGCKHVLWIVVTMTILWQHREKQTGPAIQVYHVCSPISFSCREILLVKNWQVPGDRSCAALQARRWREYWGDCVTRRYDGGGRLEPTPASLKSRDGTRECVTSTAQLVLASAAPSIDCDEWSRLAGPCLWSLELRTLHSHDGGAWCVRWLAPVALDSSSALFVSTNGTKTKQNKIVWKHD